MELKKLKKKRMMQSGKNVFDLEATFKESLNSVVRRRIVGKVEKSRGFLE